MGLKAMGHQMHKYLKKSSDLIKESNKYDSLAEELFEDIVKQLCEQYNLKVDDDEYFNQDCDGSFMVVVYGNLTAGQIAEIKKITRAQKISAIEEKRGFYYQYVFKFNFKEYWNEEYQ